jgi:hypothetical protein
MSRPDDERNPEHASHEPGHPAVIRRMRVNDVRLELSDELKESSPGWKVSLVPKSNRIDRKPLCPSPRKNLTVLRGDEGCGVTIAPHPSKLFQDPDLLPSPPIRAFGVEN